ncbi:MAG TPA: hypothetical protein VK473_15715 [Terriglobales bacterium]|nr:hypothetical protein [Terriglobales bacterium]
MDYLARGMSGVMVGVSPMTAIERLRNMKHGPNGPMWSEIDKKCSCWRCSLLGQAEIHPIQEWYTEGLRLFMEIATNTKAPKEWLRTIGRQGESK